MTPSEWLDKQPDVIDCPLGARMTKRACKIRQERRHHYVTDNALDTSSLTPTFYGCLKCERFTLKDRNQAKYNRVELNNMWKGRPKDERREPSGC